MIMAKTKKGVIRIGDTMEIEATEAEVRKAVAELRGRSRDDKERKERKADPAKPE